MKNDDQLRRAMLARPRPVKAAILCFVYRLDRNPCGRESKGRWRRPCVCIGHQGDNAWVSLGGRTILAAPDHIRQINPEDVWYPGTKDDVQ
eukprot:11043442-Alexandrium_andersonii.AAC.1